MAATSVYLTGADGIVGTALSRRLRSDPRTAAWPVYGVSRSDFDIADTDAVLESVTRCAPQVVVHAAANAVVDDCEVDPAGALAVNAGGVRNVALAASRVGARFVYLSSDYVFDGRTPPPGGYRETDLPSPLSVYGASKLVGEHIAGSLPGALVVRTSWLFGGGSEDVDVVLQAVRRASRHEPVPLVADQFSRPTYAGDLAAALVFLLTADRPVTGTVHAAAAGDASWYDVGRLVFSLLPPPDGHPGPVPVPLDSLPLVGRRPRRSGLNTDRLAALGHRMPPWADGVRRFCAELRHAGAAR